MQSMQSKTPPNHLRPLRPWLYFDGSFLSGLLYHLLPRLQGPAGELGELVKNFPPIGQPKLQHWKFAKTFYRIWELPMGVE